MPMKLYIKNMVSVRCKLLVKEELENLGLRFVNVELGNVEISENISPAQLQRFEIALLKLGLELINDKKSMLIEKIKNVIVELVHHSHEPLKTNFSEYLNKKLEYNYVFVARLFSEVEGITIERFLITHKIEHAKELIVYDELNLTEIAWKLHYSSVAHLSYQFKKITGLSPSHFKKLKHKRRQLLEMI